MELHLIHAGKYVNEQRGRQVNLATHISLAVSGKVYSRGYAPSGKFLGEGDNNQLAISPPGNYCDFCYNKQRENYVVICDIPSLHFDKNEEHLLLTHNENEIQVKRSKKLQVSETLYYRSIFEKIIQLQKSPVPSHLFMIEELCAQIVADLAVSFNDGTSEQDEADPASLLKTELDNDLQFVCSLNELCKKIGYSTGYLRRCFCKRYGIDPREYRLRRRLDRILFLLNHNEMSQKEIADAVGMKNVTHLHAFLQQRCGMSPGDLQKHLP